MPTRGGSLLQDLQRWELVHDLHGFQADGHDSFEKVDDVARVVGPVVGVVDDAGVLVDLYLVPVDDSLNRGAGAELVAVRLFRDVGEGHSAVVDDGRAVRLSLLLRNLHLLDVVQLMRWGAVLAR